MIAQLLATIDSQASKYAGSIEGIDRAISQSIKDNLKLDTASSKVISYMVANGYSPEGVSPVKHGPFVFGQVLLAAGAAVGTQFDLCTAGAGTGIGPISDYLFPNGKPAAGRPNTLVFADKITVEFDTDSYQAQTAQFYQIMTGLELEHSFSVGEENKTTYYSLANVIGTVSQASSYATSVPATTVGGVHRKAISFDARKTPIYLQNDTFGLKVANLTIPALPADTPIRVIVDGWAISNLADVEIIRSIYLGASEEQRPFLRALAQMSGYRRRIAKSLGFSE